MNQELLLLPPLKDSKISIVRLKETISLASFCIVSLLVQSCNINNKTHQDEFPVLNLIINRVVSKDKKTEITLEETNGDRTRSVTAQIKLHGGFSISFPKKSYEIDFKKDVSLAGLPTDDDWILNASYIDKTFLRHVFSYNLFVAMNKNNRAARYKYVELELNGQYNGLYILMEKLDKSSLGIDGEDPEAVIFKEPHVFRANYENINSHNPNNVHHQTYPKINLSDKTPLLQNMRNVILTDNDNTFSQYISTTFDIENVIDWHMLLLMSNNNDGILKNFYLYKVDSKTPIRISPWDYDHSFGRDGDNEINMDERPLQIERSILFARLLKLDWYKDRIKERWQELNDNDILSEKGLTQTVLAQSKLIKQRADKNFKIWPVDDSRYFDSNNFDEEIAILLKYIPIRHKRLNLYFADL